MKVDGNMFTVGQNILVRIFQTICLDLVVWFSCVFCGYSGYFLEIDRSSLVVGITSSYEKQMKHMSTYPVNSYCLKNLVISIKINIIIKEK